jgi:hypothetical protein
MENDKEMIEISKEEYKHLLEDSKMLSALEQAGVDNWEGYDDARIIFMDEEDN